MKMLTNTLLRRMTAFAFAFGLAVTAVGLAAQSSTIVPNDPWMREPLARAEQTGVFVVLENKSNQKRQLVSAASPIAERVELHTMSMDKGMMKMTQVKAIDIPASGKAELKPGSFHIMLFGLKEKPAAGASVDLTLTFDNGDTLPIKAVVRKPEGMR